MKQWLKGIAIMLVLVALVGQLGSTGLAANDTITTPPTRYQRADDVEYVIVSGTVVNWGARGEECTFLSTYAESYYTGSFDWETLSGNIGGTGTSDAYSSQLYQELQSMMKTKHTRLQGYQDTRAYYKYTDCVANDYSLISSFYSGKTANSTWDGSTYNREHIWPKSKCLYNNKTNDSADIMMLRATISSENSSRGNSAYGESSGYYDPGISVRGDCARMVLYGYVRWGNTGKMWGSSGVIESLDILLKWMEEDPVDTWEMGRNDSVQSITGVRNVFVDYPEFAWLLFGEEVPDNMVTPSGNKSDSTCMHKNTELRNVVEASCLGYGYTGDLYCVDCGKFLQKGSDTKLGSHRYDEWIDAGDYCIRYCYYCGEVDYCEHTSGQIEDAKAATCIDEGFTGNFICDNCGYIIKTGEIIPATGNHSFSEWITVPGGGKESRWCSICNYEENRDLPECTHETTELNGKKDPTCTEDGYTGDILCYDCGCFIVVGEPLPATGHLNKEVIDDKAVTCEQDGYTGNTRCIDCGELLESGQIIPAPGHQHTELRGQKDATCSVSGYSGDLYCNDCNTMLEQGSLIHGTGKHEYGDWTEHQDQRSRSCKVCGRVEQQKIAKDQNPVWPIILVGVAVVIVIGSVCMVVIMQKKRK